MKMKTATPLITIIVIVLIGCEKTTRMAKTKTYKKDGIAFLYPGDWKVTDDCSEGSIRSIYIESPGNVICAIHEYPKEMTPERKEYEASFLESIKKKYDIDNIVDAPFEPVEMMIDGRLRIGLRKQVSVTGFDKEMTHQHIYYRVQREKSVVYLGAYILKGDDKFIENGIETLFTTYESHE